MAYRLEMITFFKFLQLDENRDNFGKIFMSFLEIYLKELITQLKRLRIVAFHRFFFHNSLTRLSTTTTITTLYSLQNTLLIYITRTLIIRSNIHYTHINYDIVACYICLLSLNVPIRQIAPQSIAMNNARFRMWRLLNSI